MPKAAKLREQAEKALRLPRQIPDHLTSARPTDLAKNISRAESLESGSKP
jgi:hypothetical protein